MKKLLLSAVLLITAMASAQKNSILLGGNVGFSSEKKGEAKTENFEFSPKVGYQFADQWTIGVEGAVMTVKSKGNDTTEKYKIGGFVRYNVPLSDVFSIYADLGAGYQCKNVNDAKGMYASFTPALFINMKKGFGLNFSIGGINYDKFDGTNDSKEERFGFNFGQAVNIGISKNFGL